MVRAKFKCANHYTLSSGTICLVFDPVWTGSEENEAFFAATPAGQISLSVVDKATSKYFEVGQEYYIDFTKAELVPIVQTSQLESTASVRASGSFTLNDPSKVAPGPPDPPRGNRPDVA